MSNIFQINEKYLEVLEMVNQDVDPQIIEDTLESIESELHEKVDNTIGLKRSVDGDVDVIDKEIKRLQDIKKQKQNLSDRLKQILQDMLDQRDLQKYRTPTNYIYKRKNAPSVYVTNESLLDKSYFIQQEPKLNKKQIKEDIKAGVDVTGAELRDSESLVIK
ncbi:siphovirus Gp157 family protein [Staphylococcus coagulans]|uniref:Siphovirus Gp157 family protein n=1 Tax=Staphylococcus coagulans TaxID=74706 RepID=A0ABU1F1D7_9STAP|nr:siphovirus Gp157 family protein [Staphylococcus coagulans]MDR5603938.1 siphovirus Gp157 family protein [Staphylococcus coagulans]MDR9833868.1 siphovirus Gp157 family protein [Staphylococcus coagulans]